MGLWLRVDSRFRDFLSERYRNVVEEAFWQAPTLYIFSYMLVVLGLCMVVASLFGCFGVTAERKPILVLFIVTSALLMIATIAALAYLMFKKDGISVELADALTYMVQHYYQGAGIVQESLDRLQTTFRCCGSGGCGDFFALYLDLPRSCSLRCDGCHLRVMIALETGFSVAFTIFSTVVLAELVAIIVCLIIVMRTDETWNSIDQNWASRYYFQPKDERLDYLPSRTTKSERGHASHHRLSNKYHDNSSLYV